MIIYAENPPCIIKPYNKCFIFKEDNEAGRHIIKNGIFEKNLIEWCQQFCSKNKNILDIGAHMGTYSILLSEYSNHVYAFEAQKMTYYQLCGGIALNNINNITAYYCVVGSPEMEGRAVPLIVSSEDGGGSSIYKLPTNQKYLWEEKVLARTIDSFNLGNISFIKIDVEGAELAVFKGMTRTLENSGFPPVLFEAWPDDWYKSKKNELFEYIKSIGYTIVPISGYNNMFLATRK